MFVASAGMYLLTQDIPSLLQQTDKSAAEVAIVIGVPNPPPHMATYVWQHPRLTALAVLAIFLLGVSFSWGIEQLVTRKRRGPPQIWVQGDPVRNLVTLRSALSYRAFHNWTLPDVGPVDRITFLGSAAKEFEAYALNDVLPIWGTTGPNDHVPTKIPAAAWREQQVDRQSLHEIQSRTEYKKHPPHEFDVHHRLSVNRKDVEALFPRPMFWRLKRWLRRLRGGWTHF